MPFDSAVSRFFQWGDASFTRSRHAWARDFASAAESPEIIASPTPESIEKLNSVGQRLSTWLQPLPSSGRETMMNDADLERGADAGAHTQFGAADAEQAMTATMATEVIFRPVSPIGTKVEQAADATESVAPSRADAEEDHPAVEEGEQGAEGVADVEIEPARVRLHRAQLAIGERAHHRQHAPEEPGHHGPADRAARLGNTPPGTGRCRSDDAPTTRRATSLVIVRWSPSATADGQRADGR
jgi:hypothetical protein